MNWKRVTQADVARSLGLSPATVALVIGKTDNPLRARLKKETVLRIQKKAKELGYRLNQVAHVMSKGRTNLIVHFNWGGNSELAGVRSYNIGQMVHEAGFDYQGIDSYWWAGDGSRLVEQVVALQPEGVVISGALQGGVDLHPLHEAGIPTVGLGLEVSGSPWVRYDARTAMAELTTCCLEAGRDPALLLSGVSGVETWQCRERRLGYLDALKKAQLSSSGVFDLADFPGFPEAARPVLYDNGRNQHLRPFQIGETAGQQILRHKELPNALVCINDFYAIGVMTAFSRAGIQVPEDVAVTGFDDLSYSEQGPTSLTTVEQPIREMCVVAMKLLLKQMDGIPSGQLPQEQVLPCRIHFRASTRSERQLEKHN